MTKTFIGDTAHQINKPKTEAGWLADLKEVYAGQTGTPLQSLTKPLPGFDKADVSFIDVAKVARDAFEYRATHEAKNSGMLEAMPRKLQTEISLRSL